MSRFDSIQAEAAWAVYMHGFAETDGSSESDQGYVFSTVTFQVLLNLGEIELAERWVLEYNTMATLNVERYIIACENSQGFVHTVLIEENALTAEIAWGEITASITSSEEEVAP